MTPTNHTLVTYVTALMNTYIHMNEKWCWHLGLKQKGIMGLSLTIPHLSKSISMKYHIYGNTGSLFPRGEIC